MKLIHKFSEFEEREKLVGKLARILARQLPKNHKEVIDVNDLFGYLVVCKGFSNEGDGFLHLKSPKMSVSLKERIYTGTPIVVEVSCIERAYKGIARRVAEQYKKEGYSIILNL